jgi:hypothetical protein
MMSVGKRTAALMVLLFTVDAWSLNSQDALGGLIPLAQAQPLRNLIARLRGQTLPEGIVKSNGRLEATQVRLQRRKRKSLPGRARSSSPSPISSADRS